MPRVPARLIAALAGAAVLPALAGAAFARPACAEAERKMVEAGALRVQAREDARIGDRAGVCETLDEVGDRYDDAKGLFEACGRSITAIEIRSSERNLDGLRHANGCS